MGRILAIVLGVSLFCGTMIGWVGPIFLPAIAQVAQPIVCSGGEMEQETIRTASAGEVAYNTAFQCYRGESETGEDVTVSAIFAAIGIYSAIAFVIILAFGLRMIGGHMRRMRGAIRGMNAPGVTVTGRKVDMSGATLDTKLEVLANLRQMGLIDDARHDAMAAEARAKEERRNRGQEE